MKDTFQNIDKIQIKVIDSSTLSAEFEQFLILKNYNSEIHFPGSNVNDFNQTKLEELKQYLDEEKAYVFGAYLGKILIGFIWGYPHIFFDEKRIFVNCLVVNKEYEKNGIGKRLLAEIEKIAINKGFDSIDLTVAPFNTNAVGFYEHIGFKSERIQMCKKVKDKIKK